MTLIYKIFIFIFQISFFLAITGMVQDAKNVALNIHDQHIVSRWRESNKNVC